MCVCVCVCVCARACVRACMCVCVSKCMPYRRGVINNYRHFTLTSKERTLGYICVWEHAQCRSDFSLGVHCLLVGFFLPQHQQNPKLCRRSFVFCWWKLCPVSVMMFEFQLSFEILCRDWQHFCDSMQFVLMVCFTVADCWHMEVLMIFFKIIYMPVEVSAGIVEKDVFLAYRYSRLLLLWLV